MMITKPIGYTNKIDNKPFGYIGKNDSKATILETSLSAKH